MKIFKDKLYTRDGQGCPGIPVPTFGTGSVIRKFDRDSNLRRRDSKMFFPPDKYSGQSRPMPVPAIYALWYEKSTFSDLAIAYMRLTC